MDLKIKKSNRDKDGPEKKTKEKDQKISYAFLGTDKTQLDDFMKGEINELGRM